MYGTLWSLLARAGLDGDDYNCDEDEITSVYLNAICLRLLNESLKTAFVVTHNLGE
jgi:hypothetical protein